MSTSGEAAAANRTLLTTLERLLAIPTTDLKIALSLACDAVADAVHADKVDAFLYNPERDTLESLGTSNQPLSAKQIRHGLDVLPISNGGRVVHVYKTGVTYVTGHLELDTEELRGMKETLNIHSQVGVPLDVGDRRRGMLMIASQRQDAFDESDVSFAKAVARWVGSVAHRAELVQEIGRNAVEQGRRAVAEELVTVLAHDLRNYLAPIALRLRTIRRRAELDNRDTDVGDADAALRKVARLSTMISDILDVARIDQGVLQIDRCETDLTALVEDVSKDLSTPEHSIRFEVSEDIIVDADPARLRQCLENVLSNALKYSPEDSPITVMMRRFRNDAGYSASIEIADEGPGIPPDLLPHIFERFVSGERNNGGLGLGLYLARRIAKLHGGDLCVQSQLGTGARFTLTLPCSGDERP